jgi:hypothetical protein
MLHSPIGNAKPPASVRSQILSFDANQTIEINPGFTLRRQIWALHPWTSAGCEG